MKKEDKFKVVLTGGHLSPMLSMLEKLGKDFNCVVIGRKNSFEKDNAVSLEYTVLSNKNIPFYNLAAARLQRKLTSKTIPSFFKGPGSILQALKILRVEKPDVVLTFGGYIGLPVSLAAKVLNIPVILHEQTQKAGLTNKIISKFAYKICISFPSSLQFFPKSKTVITGNPIRHEVLVVEKSMDIKIEGSMLTIMGGSSGSHVINELVLKNLPAFLEKFTVLHQTGSTEEYKDYEAAMEKKLLLPLGLAKKYYPLRFINPDEIGWVYKNTEVFIARAGANTVSELLVLKKKAVLVPLAISQNNEQLENAKLYMSNGGGAYIEQKDATPELLLSKVLEIKNEKTTIQQPDWYNKDAAVLIADIVLTAAKHHENQIISSPKIQA